MSRVIDLTVYPFKNKCPLYFRSRLAHYFFFFALAIFTCEVLKCHLAIATSWPQYLWRWCVLNGVAHISLNFPFLLSL